MSNLVQPVVNGKIPNSTATTTTSKETETKGTTKLGQNAFMKLLVCEMQNQDPLEPTSNTEWISQLANFSQLEELQSLSKSTENSQLFSMVGKNVVVAVKDAAGNATLKSGIVDFISLSGGEAKFSVNGSLYSIDDLYSLVDADYLYNENKPTVVDEVKFKFDGNKPEDLKFKVTMGEDAAKATEVAIMVGQAILSPEYVMLEDSTVTISQKILQEMKVGSYQFSVIFNDERITSVEDKISVEIYNSHPTVTGEDTEQAEEPETNQTEDTDETNQTETPNETNQEA